MNFFWEGDDEVKDAIAEKVKDGKKIEKGSKKEENYSVENPSEEPSLEEVCKRENFEAKTCLNRLRGDSNRRK